MKVRGASTKFAGFFSGMIFFDSNSFGYKKNQHILEGIFFSEHNEKKVLKATQISLPFTNNFILIFCR